MLREKVGHLGLGGLGQQLSRSLAQHLGQWVIQQTWLLQLQLGCSLARRVTPFLPH